jgi:DNA-binding MarR family transcriptional regulator
VNTALSSEQLLLDNQLCFALYSASNAIVRAYKPFLEPLDLTYPQYLVMLVLWQQDGLTVSQLGEHLYLDSGTLTPLLKRMEGKQLLERLHCQEDERKRIIVLTEAGKALHERALNVPEQMKGLLAMNDQQLQLLKTNCEWVQQQLRQND